MIALIDQVTKSASNQSEENSFGSAYQKHKITRKLIAIYHKIQQDFCKLPSVLQNLKIILKFPPHHPNKRYCSSTQYYYSIGYFYLFLWGLKGNRQQPHLQLYLATSSLIIFREIDSHIQTYDAPFQDTKLISKLTNQQISITKIMKSFVVYTKITIFFAINMLI